MLPTNLRLKGIIFLFGMMLLLNVSSCVRYENPVRELTYYATEDVKTQSPPSFPGGYSKLVEFIRSEARNSPDKIVLGRKVLICAQIDETGKVTGLKPAYNANLLLAEELKRIALLMPTWQPGIVNRKGVITDYTFELK